MPIALEEVDEVRDAHAFDLRAHADDDVLRLDGLDNGHEEVLLDNEDAYLLVALPDGLEPLDVCALHRREEELAVQGQELVEPALRPEELLHLLPRHRAVTKDLWWSETIVHLRLRAESSWGF